MKKIFLFICFFIFLLIIFIPLEYSARLAGNDGYFKVLGRMSFSLGVCFGKSIDSHGEIPNVFVAVALRASYDDAIGNATGAQQKLNIIFDNLGLLSPADKAKVVSELGNLSDTFRTHFLFEVFKRSSEIAKVNNSFCSFQ